MLAIQKSLGEGKVLFIVCEDGKSDMVAVWSCVSSDGAVFVVDCIRVIGDEGI